MTRKELVAQILRKKSFLCIGLDSDLEKIPQHLNGFDDPVFEFNKQIIDATHPMAIAYKPNLAFYESRGIKGWESFSKTINYLKENYPEIFTIADAKRGDIGSTAEFYAVEAFERYRADAVTLNPYLGTDAARPMLERGGVIALCRTSNPGSAEVQDLPVEGRPLHLHVAEMVAERWSKWGDCALVVGATYPAQLAEVRRTVGDLPVLVPGIGAQGGDLEASVAAGRDAHGTGLIISSSRQILYGSTGEDFAAVARAEALRTRDAIAAAVVASGSSGTTSGNL